MKIVIYQRQQSLGIARFNVFDYLSLSISLIIISLLTVYISIQFTVSGRVANTFVFLLEECTIFSIVKVIELAISFSSFEGTA